LQAIVGGTLERWFHAGFREREPRRSKAIGENVLGTKPEGYIACGRRARHGHREIIKSIRRRHGHRRQADAGTTGEGEFIRAIRAHS
jgi:hypothetical protein